MKGSSLRMSAVIPAPAADIYAAWLSGKGHAAMTGSPATGRARVGGRFTAWEGYIEGKNLELVPHSRIVQAWRTTDFPAGAPDSLLEVQLSPAKGGTKVTLVHTGIPEGQAGGYREGWAEYYFSPMKEYFSTKAPTGR